MFHAAMGATIPLPHRSRSKPGDLSPTGQPRSVDDRFQKYHDSVRLSALACPQSAADTGAAAAAIEERDAGAARAKKAANNANVVESELTDYGPLSSDLEAACW